MEITMAKRVDYVWDERQTQGDLFGSNKPASPDQPEWPSYSACVALGMALNSLQIMLLNAQFDAISILDNLRSGHGA
jgi:hypothetical protein